MMNILDLFSGIGGFSLAGRWMGWETALFCEIDPFCRKVLNKNFPNVPIHDDIKTLTLEKINEYTSNTIDIITGGFPCQPYSIAGKRKGKEDERALWDEMFRVICEVKPAWVLGENVANFEKMGLEQACIDLEGQGYAVQPFVIPACAVNAPHQRSRLWIIAHANRKPTQAGMQNKVQGFSEISGCENDGIPAHIGDGWMSFEPKLLRTDNGVSRKLDRDRVKCLGNSVVPQVVYQLFRAIEDHKDNAS